MPKRLKCGPKCIQCACGRSNTRCVFLPPVKPKRSKAKKKRKKGRRK